MNPGLKREPWDRTRPDENWNEDDHPPRKPAKVEHDWVKRRKDYLIETGRVPASERERGKVTAVQPTAQKSANKMKLYWQTRPCFICEKRGFCQHREFAVARAYVCSI
jgi:hypothetical protein